MLVHHPHICSFLYGLRRNGGKEEGVSVPRLDILQTHRRFQSCHIVPSPRQFSYPDAIIPVSRLIDIPLTIRARPRSPLGPLHSLALPMPIAIRSTIIRTSSFTLPVLIHHWPRELLRVHVLILLLLLISTMAFVGTVIRLVSCADQTLDCRTSGRHWWSVSDY